MIAIRASLLIRSDDRIQFLIALPGFVTASRNESGCTWFAIAEDAQEANRFYVIGEFKSQAALDQHERADHTEAFRQAVIPLIDSLEQTLVFTISHSEPLQRRT